MSLMTRTGERTGESKTRSGSPLKVPEGARILIVCDDNSDTERLKGVLREAGFVSEWARSITEGCKAAKSGRFQVVVSTPVLSDGSWRRLTDIANHYDLGFEVVLWARSFDLLEWTEALKDGAFDVLGQSGNQIIATAVATPEPGSLMLLGSGLLGLSGAMRKKFKK